MADSSVLLEVIVEGKNIKIVQREVEELASSINKSTDKQKKQDEQQKKNKKSTKELAEETKNYNRGQKGVAGATANGTKAFSKQRDLIGSGSSGLVGAYATLAANLFAATALFGALQRAAQVETLVQGIQALGASSGQSIGLLATNLKEATNNAISLDQALRTASFASSSGFSATQIQNLAEVGKKAAIALGRDVGDAVDRLTRGVAKLEPEILDELGIIVRLDDATASYAASIGKSVKQLTAFERQQAFANATITQGLAKFGEIEVDPNPYDQLSAAFQDLSKSALNLINNVLGPLVSFLAENRVALAALIAVLTKGIVAQALPIFTQLAQKARDFAVATREGVKEAAKAQKKAFKGSKKSLSELSDSQGKASKAFTEMFSKAKGYDDLIEAEKKLKASIDARTRALTRAGRKQESIDKSKEDISELTQLQKKLGEELAKQGKPGLSIESAENLSKIAEQRASLFESLDEDPSIDNFKKKFSEAKTLGKEYADEMRNAGKFQLAFLNDLPLLGNKLTFLSKGFEIAAVGVSRFGIAGQVALRGLTYAIPVYGQVVFVLSVLWGVLKKVASAFVSVLPEATKLEKAQEALSEKAKTLVNTTKKQESSLISLAAEQAQYNSILSETSSEKEKSIALEELQRKAIVAATNNTEAQGFAIKELLDSQKEYDKQLKITEGNLSYFGMIIKGIGDLFSAVGFQISRGAKKMAMDLKALIIDTKSLIADAAESSEAFAKFFGITQAEIAATREESRLFEEQLKRTFQPQDVKALSDIVGGRLRTTFLDVFEGSAEAARGLTDVISGVGSDINPQTLLQNINSAIENVNAEGLTDALKQAAIEADKNLSGSLDTAAEKQAFLNALLQLGTKEIVQKSEQIKILNSGIDGATDSISKFITGLTESKTSTTEIVNALSTIVSTLQSTNIESDQLASILDKLPISAKSLLDFERLSNDEKAQAVINLYNQLNLINTLEQVEKRRLGILKQQSSFLKQAEANSITALKQRLEVENASAEVSKELVDARITIADQVYQAEKRNLEETNKIRQEQGLAALTTTETLVTAQNNLNNLKDEQAKIQASILTDEQIQLETQMQALSIAERQVKLISERAQLAAKTLENENKIANVLSGRGPKLTEGQELEAQIKSAEVAVTAAEAELNLAQARLQVERSILNAKLTAMNTQIKTYNDTRPAGTAEVEGINKDLILADFDAASRAAMESFTLKVEQAKANLKGTLIDAAFGNMEETNNPVSQMVDQVEAAVIRAKAAMQLLKDENDPFVGLKMGIQNLSTALDPMIEKLKSMGPEGELVAAVAQGGLQIADSLATLSNATSTTAEKLEAISGIIGAIGSIAAASSQAKIAAIDKEIAAEKARDGKSKESLAKIAAMEKKKEAQQKKAFEVNKKIQMAQVIIGTAAAMVSATAASASAAAAAGPGAPAVFGAVMGMMSPLILGLGAAQLAIIAGTSYQGGGNIGGGASSTPTSISIGERKSSVDLAKSQSASGELAYMRGESGTGGPENFTPAFMGAKYRATGGPTTGYVVGEQGPELFVPEVPGNIVPNSQIQQAPATSVNFTITALDASGVEDILVRQRGNLIGMMREAANSYGQPFLEGVDTASYTQTAGGVTKY